MVSDLQLWLSVSLPHCVNVWHSCPQGSGLRWEVRSGQKGPEAGRTKGRINQEGTALPLEGGIRDEDHGQYYLVMSTGGCFASCYHLHLKDDGRDLCVCSTFEGGVPICQQGEGVPHQVLIGTTPILPDRWITPSFPMGVPHSSQWGPGYLPHQDWYGGATLDQDWMGYPCAIRTGCGYLLPPPHRDWMGGTPPPYWRHSSYAAGGMPLAFMQEDFLVIYSVLFFRRCELPFTHYQRSDRSLQQEAEARFTRAAKHLILYLAPKVSNSLKQHTSLSPSSYKHAIITVHHVFVFLSRQTVSPLQIKHIFISRIWCFSLALIVR